MASIVLAVSVANTLLTALNNSLVKEAFLRVVAERDRFETFKGIIETVKQRLLEEDKIAEHSEGKRDYIDKLKDVVYDAEDIFDKLVTRDECSTSEMVSQLFSRENLSKKIRKLSSRLERIKEAHATYGLSNNTEPHKGESYMESFSSVDASKVVGRDNDAKKVIDMLLKSRECVDYYVAIVGIGGVGKSTFAKLIFDHEKIKDEFPKRLWVGVSDRNGVAINIKYIFSQLLKSLKCKTFDSSSVESLQLEYKRNLEGKRFLLVLDDIWSEKKEELRKLKNYLMIEGGLGRIIATTRSKETARIIGNDTHPLKGLSEKHSRHLFEMEAFSNGDKQPELVEIGKKIVNQSSNVPISIIVISGLLKGEPIATWKAFETNGFDRFSKSLDEIMSILKSSYDHLDSSLKSCFAYCAIFPKDYVISKEMIINLWDSQGYIVPFNNDQSKESAGEEHFSILLQRCFFDDVKNDELGDAESFKIHGLMHDLAKRVSGKEICMINANMPNLESSVRHLSVSRPINSDMRNSERIHSHLIFKVNSKIRSYLIFKSSRQVEPGDDAYSRIIAKNWSCLRALALPSTNVTLNDSIGDLLHLRYLNLTYSKMKKLPDSIIGLHNLQTLNISYCELFEEWPKKFCKLVNLTHLYTDGCLQLACMPFGLSKLVKIRTLTEFVVEDETANGRKRVGQLTDLNAFSRNLKGAISIRFGKYFKGAEGYGGEESCLKDAEHLNHVVISFSSKWPVLMEEVVMERLGPHRNLRKFTLIGYIGEKIASWGSAQENRLTFLPMLVHIELHDCCGLKELPTLSKLQLLKTLSLKNLRVLEYMEEEVKDCSCGSGSTTFIPSNLENMDVTFFPSLEFLQLSGLPNLIRWWKSGDCNESHCRPVFPNLSKLDIGDCPRLILLSFPRCPSNLESELNRRDNNEKLMRTKPSLLWCAMCLILLFLCVLFLGFTMNILYRRQLRQSPSE